MKNPLISIVVCTYNRAEYLHRTISSALSQDYSPFEVVVYDDGSRDETPELMKTFGSKIRYHWNENQGIALARTEACKLAKGELIAFIDDDDIMPPNRLNLLLKAITKYPEAVMAVGDWAEIDFDDQLTGNQYLPKGKTSAGETILYKDGHEAVLWPKVPAAPHTVLFWKIYGERIDWFDAQYKKACEDKDFFARMGRLGPIVYVPQIVSHYRRGHCSLTSDRVLTALQTLEFLKNHLNYSRRKNRKLYKRIQFRIFIELIKIAFLESNGVKIAGSISVNILKSSVLVLSYPLKIRYWWYTRVRLKLKRLVKKRTNHEYKQRNIT